jgi:hypothetical protein
MATRVLGAALGAAVVMPWLGGTAAAQSHSVLMGTVAGVDSTRFLPGAEVVIAKLRRHVRTDSAGVFRMERIPAGTHAIQVRQKGYALLDTTLSFTGRDTLASEFVLADASDTVDATSMKMLEFERHRAKSMGWFITREQLENEYDRPLSEVLAHRIPGLRAIPNQRGSGAAMASGRGPGAQSQVSSGDGYSPACYTQLFVDGTRVFAAGSGMYPVSIDEWRTSDIEGIEYYPAVQQTPPEYAGMGSLCGTLSLWLRVE